MSLSHCVSVHVLFIILLHVTEKRNLFHATHAYTRQCNSGAASEALHHLRCVKLLLLTGYD